MKKLYPTLFLSAFFLFAQAQNSVKRVLIEEFTGNWCGYCTDGAAVVNQILAAHPGGDVIAVSVHDADGMEFNDGLRTAFSVTSYPSALIDRTMWSGQTTVWTNRSLWAAEVSSRLADPSPVTVDVTNIAFNASTRKITATVTAHFTDDATANASFRMSMEVIEDSVQGTGSTFNQTNYYNVPTSSPYYGPNPIVNYMHRHVLRGRVPSAFGMNGIIPSSVTAGSDYSYNVTYTLPYVVGGDSVNLNRIHLVGIVSNYGTNNDQKQVVNVSEEKSLFGAASGIAGAEIKPVMILYPNPATGGSFELNLTSVKSVSGKIVVRDMLGRQVIIASENFAVNNESKILTIPTAEIASGLYAVSYETENGVITSTLMIQH